MEHLLAAIGALFLIWSLAVRLVPDFAEWRCAELYAWCNARLRIVWHLHWQTYRAFKP